MHVAYIHQHFTTPRGSSGTRSYEMSRRLLAAGHRVTMVSGAYEHRDADVDLTRRVTEYHVDGIDVKCIAESYANWMGFSRRVLAFGRFAAAATRVVSRLDADLILATSTPLTVGIPGMKAARRLGVPFVFEVRDLWPEIPIAMGIIRNPMLTWYLRRLERRIYRAADWVIALAPGIKEGVCRTGFPPERVALIPNCCDVDLFQPGDQRLQDERFGEPDDFRLVFTGAHGRANGLDAVLDAAAELRRRGQTGVRFVFIGQGSEKQRLMDRSRREQLDDLVSWVPPMSKQSLARILPGMGAGMQILKNVPAFYYGTSPNKFFDYIACGLPVLNNYPGWLADLIQQHECGVAVPPDDPGAFADAVLWLRDHPDQRRQMGRRARDLAETQFARDRLADTFVQTLEHAARAPRRGPR
ncbi:MAG TPA: glycosyltransferase family 4 protein [Phycisphaerae bacterium]|nr:glycosyltransferase family 4 protein [Phycisphaerae bacterium]